MQLRNNLLTVEVSADGAELQSIKSNVTGHEYLWQGDPAFWNRRSPVLFPIVGKAWDGIVNYGGKKVEIGQHGFARDCRFDPVDNNNESTLSFRLRHNEDTLQLFPFRCELEISYTLIDERITILWKVTNLDTGHEMPFQIGAHPAFYYPSGQFKANYLNGYLAFDSNIDLTYELIEAKGCLGDRKYPLDLDADGMLPITPDLFDRDALVIGDKQLHRVSILSAQKQPYMTVLFTAPVVGLWSNPGAPFIWIEPWYGRCDRVGYNGDFADREYTNRIAPGQSWENSYCIILENI